MPSIFTSKQFYMLNKYGLPEKDLNEIINRDKVCVYCHKKMTSHDTTGKRGDWWTIEHLNYLPPWNNSHTVAICCWSCNSSRGQLKIRDWFKTRYCIAKNINESTVSAVVKEYVIAIESLIK